MGEVYKEAGGWHGVKDKFLIPLAEYQKSQGMNTPFTRLYDAYMKVKPYWEKAYKEKKPPGIGTGTGAAKPQGTALGNVMVPSSPDAFNQPWTVEQYPSSMELLEQPWPTEQNYSGMEAFEQPSTTEQYH